MTFEKVEIGAATLYRGDCLEVMQTLGKVDAVVTDPPYGLGEDNRKKHMSREELAAAVDYGDYSWDNTPAAPETIDLCRQVSRWQVIFGGNYFHLPPTSCWLVWDKLNGKTHFADCELAWTNLPKAVRRIRWLWSGMLRAEAGAREHPTQKPVGVMTWAIEHVPAPNQTVLDPFMGSGTTGIACAKLGRKFIGIEKEPHYFEIACKRIEQAYTQPDLFIEQPPKPEQQVMAL